MSFPKEALNDQLDKLTKHPFYKGRVRSGFDGPADFAASIPLMSRADLIAEMIKPGYGAFGGIDPVRINLSPMGSSLIPVMQTAGDIANLISATRSHLDACGIGSSDVCAVTFGYHMFVAGLFYQSQMEAHGVACIPIGPGEAERTVEICAQHSVTVLAGNPSFSLKLIEAGLKPPKVFFAGGEAFTGNPTLYGAVRSAMPSTALVDSFSLSEFLPVARTFPGGEGVHIFDELVYAEVIEPSTGVPVVDGERGELVLTHLKKEAQPLLRYRTGDLTVRQTTAPVHGRTVNLPRVVFGRTDEMVKVKGVKVYPSEIRSVLLGLDGPTGGYRLTVSAGDGGGDRLELALEGAGGDDVKEEITRRFKSQTLISVDEIKFEEEIKQGPVVIDART
ncbi:MAG: Phenylacetate-coenzyme A ligase [Alphaproteobacteria bacterium MarineAlpha11_Bin1]|nr:MAG: Phenylacetate-coenzyme A ligase [Alphaproteobacteria bacterium MarineAlpha11_Bin1]|tara:strand:- start:5785 stop:6957 length:1173 start_codon:yes stop_codon:yes gene_type:complete